MGILCFGTLNILVQYFAYIDLTASTLAHIFQREVVHGRPGGIGSLYDIPQRDDATNDIYIHGVMMPRTVTAPCIGRICRVYGFHLLLPCQRLGIQEKPFRVGSILRRQFVGQNPGTHTVFSVRNPFYLLLDGPVRHIAIRRKALIEILANDSFRQTARTILETVACLALITGTSPLHDIPSIRAIVKRRLFHELFRHVQRVFFRSHGITEVDNIGLQVFHSLFYRLYRGICLII